MSSLKPRETMLVGKWVLSGGAVQGDETCERINKLTNGELEFVKDNPNSRGWERLFRDKSDGRYWERTYPEGYMHGGGPPMLKCIGAKDVEAKYGLSTRA